MSDARTKVRVLLADDHVDMLKLAASTLRATCDVVATVTDGLQAVESTIRLNPSVVVLDITMPGLDGFQAARELRRRGSQAKVVFLSLHDGDEFVITAFESGGQAFVPKQRLLTDLSSAVEHVHAGRVFLPSLTSLSAIAPRGGHALMFYSRRAEWCDQAALLVRSALTRGDGVILYAPEVARTGVANRLTTYGFDTAQAVADGRYTVTDAAETLQQISSNGRPDPRRIAALVDGLESARLALPGAGSRMTVIGEIAPSVGPEHRREDMLGIERLWNEVVGDRPMLTVCAYSTDALHDESESDQLWSSMCAEHWAVSQVLDA